MLTASTPDHFASRSLEACFTFDCVPSFRSTMIVRGGCHSRCEHGLHVLRGVVAARGYRKRTNFGNVLAFSRAPSPRLYRKKPNLSHRVYDCAARSFGGLGFGPTGERVQVPISLCLCECSQSIMCDDPATEFTGAIADELARAARLS